MYLIRRIYTVEPGEARKAATLIDAIGRAYEEAGTRSASRVSVSDPFSGQYGSTDRNWEE